MKQVYLFLFSALGLYACESANTKAKPLLDSSFVITGTITSVDTGKILGFQLFSDNTPTDTIRLDKDGHFTIKGMATEPLMGNIFCINATESNRIQPLSLFVEPGITTTVASTTLANLSTAKVEGGNSNNEVREIESIISSYSKKMDALKDSFKIAYQSGNQSAFALIQDKALKLSQEMRMSVFDYAKEHPKSHAAAFYAFRFLSPEINGDVVSKVYEAFDATIKKSLYAQKIQEVLNVNKRTAIGSTAANFTLPTPEGKKIQLSDFRGRYLLLDFWASWCGPCRQENPNVVKAYQMFKNKGFTVLGVSLDEDADKWKEAIQEDKLNWTHVSDLHGWKSDCVALYGIEAIPSNFLLDKEGKIIAKNLRGKDLEDKLAEILK